MASKRNRAPESLCSSPIPSSSASTEASTTSSLVECPTTSQMLRCGRTATSTSAVPGYRVGSLEVYRRFSGAYDLLMSRHDCSELESVILRHVAAASGRISAAASTGTAAVPLHLKAVPLVVGDFGCGTGRILTILLRHCANRTAEAVTSSTSSSTFDSGAKRACALGQLTETSYVRSNSVPRLHGFELEALIGYDKEPHMLQKAHASLAALAAARGVPIIVLDVASVEALSTLRRREAVDDHEAPSRVGSVEDGTVGLCLRPFSFDHIRSGALEQQEQNGHAKMHVVVCAWSLSYVMRAQWGGNAWHAALHETLSAICGAVVRGGVVIIVETLGNGCTEPTRKSTLTDFLESEWGFQREWLRTDYHFQSTEEGAAMCKFFFAKGVDVAYRERGALVWPECTGVWSKIIE